MAYIIRHLPENTYLTKVSDREYAVWFTPRLCKALTFDRREEAERIVRAYNCLASVELQVEVSRGSR